MISTASSKRRRNWLIAVCVALFVQSMYPAGYMPASMAGGWPIMLCPNGMPVLFMASRHQQHGGHQHHGDHQSHGDQTREQQADDTCPVGKALDSQALPIATVTAASYGIVGDDLQVRPYPSPLRRFPTNCRPRGPPLTTLI